MLKSILTVLIFLSSINLQTDKLIGAWIYIDGTTSTSLFFKQNNTIEKHVGPLANGISEKNLIKGTFELKGADLKITWNTGFTEYAELKSVNDEVLQLMIKPADNKKAKLYIFKKVIDEKVIED